MDSVFHRYDEGYRFAKLASDLVEKHGFIAGRGRVYIRLASIAAWTQPITTAIDFAQTGIRAAVEAGDQFWACMGMQASIAYLLLRNDQLDRVWRRSERALEFDRKAGFDDAADIVVIQQRFIAIMQGRTATFSTFSDAEFDEATFEAQFTSGRNPLILLLVGLQTESAVPLRRLPRCAGRSRQGEAVDWSLHRPNPARRLLLLHRVNGVCAL